MTGTTRKEMGHLLLNTFLMYLDDPVPFFIIAHVSSQRLICLVTTKATASSRMIWIYFQLLHAVVRYRLLFVVCFLPINV